MFIDFYVCNLKENKTHTITKLFNIYTSYLCNNFQEIPGSFS